jgi:hypothetical protein
MTRSYAEVLEMHRIIAEGWRDKNASVDEFVAHLHPEFINFNPAGEILDINSITEWFLSSLGSKPDVHIEITDFSYRSLNNSEILVTYQEHQHFNNIVLSQIFSVVFIEEQTDQRLLWRYLFSPNPNLTKNRFWKKIATENTQ